MMRKQMSLRHVVKRYIPRPLLVRLKSMNGRRKRCLSQMGQDFWVFGEVFDGKRNGYFLEVGSADGVTLSNTFLLEKRYGWRGICIEANPLVFEDLRRVRTVTCLNVCIDAVEGEIDFLQRGLYGGIVGMETDNPPNTALEEGSRLLRLRTEPLASVLVREGAPHIIDYLSIDVEGREDRILKEFPFSDYVFNCMTVERPKEGLREVLSRNGYIVIKEIPHHDVFYVHESFLASYERNVFSFWEKMYRR
ncbi:MAG: FkbM family methyltransferase [Bacteroidota bacterium]